MELKTTAGELHEANTNFNSRIDLAEERMSESKGQLNEIKREGKIRKKERRENDTASKKNRIM